MEEMVEPDRTIMIVSIIGLVIIWGSVAYHKFVQGGSPSQEEGGFQGPVGGEAAAAGQAEVPSGQKQRKKKR